MDKSAYDGIEISCYCQYYGYKIQYHRKAEIEFYCSHHLSGEP